MNHLDLGNAFFEGVGMVLTRLNVLQLYRDREIKGVDWRVTAFWSLWGVWNLFYYPALGQWWSAAAGLVLVLGNLAWCVLALRVVRGHSWAAAQRDAEYAAKRESYAQAQAERGERQAVITTEMTAEAWPPRSCGDLTPSDPIKFSDSGALSLSTFIAPPAPEQDENARAWAQRAANKRAFEAGLIEDRRKDRRKDRRVRLPGSGTYPRPPQDQP